MLRSTAVALLAILAGLCASGCKVTSDDIDEWMGTQKGPGKIVAVLLADKYEDALRVHAAVALVRMEPRDEMDGVTELQAAVRQLPEEDRTRLVDQMAPALIALMNGEDTPQAGTETNENSAPLRQIRAKDATFLLIHYASAATRQTMTEEVVDWFVVNFNQRSLSGAFTAEQVVNQLGAPAASRLVNAMTARLPYQALVRVAELISELGDTATKTRAAERLVAIEQEMEGGDFLDWLKERLRERLRQDQGEDVEINEGRVAGAAALNRHNYLTLGALPAMKHLNEETVVQDRLLVIAQITEQEGFSGERVLERRVKALLALEGGVREDQVDALLDIALASATPNGIRNEAFNRIGDAQSTTALRRLWPEFRNTETWQVRWTVGSLILTLGGPDVVPQFFQFLDDEEYAHRELYGYGERLSQMRPPPTEFINRQLTSEHWFRQCIALFFWEKRASQLSDVSHVTPLTENETATVGEDWEAQTQQTVGEVATAVASHIRERLGEGDSGGGSE